MNRVVRSLDEIALPVPRYQTRFNFRRPVMNTDPVRNPSPLAFPSRARAPFGMAEAQPAEHVRRQCATWHGVEGGIGSFVRRLQRRPVGMHKRQCPSNPLRRVAGLQVAGDLIPQRGSWSQAARNARCDRAGMGARPGRVGTVAACHRRSSRAAMRLRSRPAVSTEFGDRVEAERFNPLAIAVWLMPLSSCVWIIARCSRLNCM